MSLLDTLDGLLMSWAYGFAASSRDGRQILNVFLTGASSAIAIIIGLVELLGCVQHELALDGPFWSAIEAANDNFELVGYAVIAFFAVSIITALVAISWPNLMGSCAPETGGAVQANESEALYFDSDSAECGSARSKYTQHLILQE